MTTSGQMRGICSTDRGKYNPDVMGLAPQAQVQTHEPKQAFTTAENTGQFLDAVVGGIFTQISIVITMLLIVLQQSAPKMGNAVIADIYYTILQGWRGLMTINKARCGGCVLPVAGALGTESTGFVHHHKVSDECIESLWRQQPRMCGS